MDLPFGSIEDGRLEVRFSSVDFSVATVIAGIAEHIDMFEELQVHFLGLATDVPAGPQPVFRPVDIVAHFQYVAGGSGEAELQRVYRALWKGVVSNFPDELDWAEAKGSYADFITAQADMLRARVENA